MASVYMKVPFAEGSVTAKGYVGWVRLNSVKFDISKSVSMEGGDVTNRKTGKTQFSHFTVEKTLEDSSGGFMQEAAQGESGHDVTIAVCTTGDHPKEYARFDLTDAIITGYNLEGSEKDPTETITVAFGSITAKYTPHDSQLSSRSPIVVMQDITSD